MTKIISNILKQEIEAYVKFNVCSFVECNLQVRFDCVATIVNCKSTWHVVKGKNLECTYI